jgi:hypothetical protein
MSHQNVSVCYIINPDVRVLRAVITAQFYQIGPRPAMQNLIISAVWYHIVSGAVGMIVHWVSHDRTGAHIYHIFQWPPMTWVAACLSVSH